MNEEIKNNALDALNQILVDAASIREFAIEQAPQVVQELLKYSMFMAWLSVLVSIFVFLFAIVGIKKSIPMVDEDYEVAIPLMLLSGLMVAAGFIALCIHTTEAVKVTIAPRVWLIEYAADLIK
jgi:uncharacterized membrane protein YedE/YeeE